MDFKSALENFLTMAQNMITEYDAAQGNMCRGLLTVEMGKKYAKVVETRGPQTSVWAFIDTTNGDVLKPASWKAPAKHARGNIFDASVMANVGPYGPNYLR